VLLTGEAGIGKSRITQALASGATGAPPVLRLECSPYRGGTALWPVIEHLARSAGIRQGDPTEARLERLQSLIATEWSAMAADGVPVLASLLSIDYEPTYRPLELEPEQLRERTLAVILEYLGVPDRELPALVVVEDVHWADPTSLELLGTLIERAAECRILVLITCRPDHPVSWLEHPHVTSMPLSRLADHDVRAIVDRVTDGKSLPDEVVDLILVRADGVPLFVEELTRAVLESGVLVDEGNRYALAGPLPDTAIPATLRDSLATRLDRLGRVKEVAQVASAIGREFTFDLLVEVSGSGRRELETSLEQLEAAGLVLRRDGHSTGWFAFKHALVQSAAYDGMLRSKRRALHERIADALIQRPGVLEDQPELVARHLDQAGLVDRAIDTYVFSGEHASAGSHHEEALVHYRRALELLAELPPSSARTERELDVHASFRNALIVLRGYSSPEVAEVCEVALALCEELGAGERSFPVLWNLAGFHMVRGEHAVCSQLNERLLEIADRAGRPELQLMAHDTVGQTLFYQARFEEAVTQFARVRELYDPDTHRHLARTYAEEDPAVASLGYGSIALWAVGRRAEALEWLDEAVELAESLPYFSSRGLMMSILVHVAYCRGDIESALAAAAAMRELSEEHGLGYYIPSARVQQGWVLAAGGRTDEGIELMREGIEGFERVGALLEQPFTALLLADGMLRGGRPAEALAVLDEKLALVEQTGERCFQTELLRVRGEARAAQDASAEDVERDLRCALELASERNARSFRLRAASSLVRFQLERGLGPDYALLADALAGIEDGLDEQDVREARSLATRVGGLVDTPLGES
jgi:predicted ATPase